MTPSPALEFMSDAFFVAYPIGAIVAFVLIGREMIDRDDSVLDNATRVLYVGGVAAVAWPAFLMFFIAVEGKL